MSQERENRLEIGLTGRAALVTDLLTTQANHIASLKWAIGILESKITLRNSLAEVQAEALKDPFREVAQVLGKLKAAIAESTDPAIRQLSADIDEGLLQVRRAVDSVAEWLSSSTDPTILYPRETLQRVPLKHVVERALNDLGPGFDRTRLELVIPPGNVFVTTAPARLAAIVTALVDNAAKHGGPGRISCVFGITAQHDLKVLIEDSGPGLKGVDPEEYFRPKPQEIHETREWQPLLGLGLFLTRMMAESLGGTVTLEEKESSGVRATVVLPQRRRRDVIVD
ncbi:MAG: ATP-binding protein [Nitrososphaerota archaeon]